jgi:hypothetical protein
MEWASPAGIEPFLFYNTALSNGEGLILPESPGKAEGGRDGFPFFTAGLAG